MKKFREYLKLNQVKTGIAAICILLILAAVFILQPESQNIPADSLTDEFFEENHTDDFQEEASADEGGGLSQSQEAKADDGNNPKPSAAITTRVNNTTNNETSKAINPTKADTTEIQSEKQSLTLSIRCDTILNNMDMLDKDKLSVLPSDGIIMPPRKVEFSEGDSVFDVLQRETRAAKIHMEFTDTPMYDSAYIEGINNIYEFDCGALSGWIFKVNGQFPVYGCSQYKVKNGDVIEWVYSCDLGNDVGRNLEGE